MTAVGKRRGRSCTPSADPGTEIAPRKEAIRSADPIFRPDALPGRGRCPGKDSRSRDKESSMHLRSWVFVTVGTLLLTAFVLGRAGWLRDQSASASGKRVAPRVHASAQDLFASESGARFR